MKNKIAIFLAALIAIIPTYLTAQEFQIDDSDRPFGEYLTARHALFNHQYDVAAENYLHAVRLDPENVELLQFSMNVFVAAGRFEDALDNANKLRELNEENDVSNLIHFFDLVRNKNYEEALPTIDGLASTGIMNLVKPIFKSWIYAEQGNFEEISKIAESYEGEDGSFNFFNFFQMGLIYEYIGELEKAESYYSRGLAERGLTNLRAVEAYSKILRKLGKLEEAELALNQYIETAPGNENLKSELDALHNNEASTPLVSSLEEGYAELFYTVATILMQDNVKGIATNFLQYALVFKTEFPLAHFMQAQIFESDEYYNGAADQLARIKNDSPLYFQSKLQRAWLFDEMDRSEETIAALREIEKEYPNNREVLNSIAEFYRLHERFAEAIPAYTKVIETIENETERDWIVYYTRGIVFDQEKRWPEAESDFKKALQLRPEQPMVLNYLAYSWVDQGVNYELAKKMLIRAVELRPNDGYIVDSLGWALYKMGDEEEAVEVLERAAQLQTQDWAINDHLGDAYWTVGRKNEARFQWRHALSLSPDESDAEVIKSKIENGYVKPDF
ncbi:tetratricopeptide repeat protein [Pseudemcibacter aquimaris]|uniref:tetratricopeptide repeat protein n=1 Tax=Pseudemcibacter aquimaris TaxID=2857064 RepID=UPI002012DAB6|nr:tetratricopeptide repeat protein [Pseudemcibacter aquimaris]MCC3859696.1 tetratricopeptide repeat protein [Pseudemcibacter aquimaris]WDU60091.1 tetratricopeptide repeat protein [Pseudemcibacter aquimaris]